MADTKSLKFLLLGEDRSASKALKGVGREAEKSAGALDKIRSGAMRVGGALVAAFAVDKIVDFAGSAIASFSKVEDSAAAASVVFGDSMGKITAQAENAASTMGMTKAQVMDAANTYGTFGKSAGLAGDDLAKFSTDMTQLAGDMASFRGTSPEEAIEAIGAAFRGEAEPIRKYGVMLDAATIEQEAMRMGLLKTSVDQGKLSIAQSRAKVAQMNYNEAVRKHGPNSKEAISASAGLKSAQEAVKKAAAGTKGELTAQQKVLAAQSVILKQTKNAQGDFARTSDSTANRIKAGQAKWENFTAQVGGKLAPVLVKIIDLGEGVLKWMDANPEAVEGASAAFDGLVGVIEFLGNILGMVLKPVLVITSRGIAAVTGAAGDMLDALSTVPTFEWAKGAAEKLHKVSDGANAAADGIDAIGSPDINVQPAMDKMTAFKLAISNLPEEKQTELLAVADKQGLDAAEKLLDTASRDRYTKIIATATTANSGWTSFATGTNRWAMRAYAKGGRPRVGELAMFHKDELWVPDTAGTVLTASKTSALMGGPSPLGGGGGNVYITVAGDSDPDGAARRIAEKLTRLKRNRGGGPLPFE